MALQNDVLRLAELDQKADQLCKKETGEEFIRVLGEYAKLRISLRDRLLDEGVVSIEDAKAREVLRKISSGEGLRADNLVKVFGKFTGNSDLATFGELNDTEEMEELSWVLFNPYEYVRGLDELRLLIPECDASPTVDRLVKETRRCYAFQQYDAATTRCRALLEAAVRDICECLGLIRRSSKSYGDDWGRLLGKVTCELDIEEPLEFKGKLKRLYGDLCKVAHAEREATPQEALTEFHETLSAIEKLYERLAKKQSGGA